MSPEKIKEVTKQYRALLLHMPPESGPFDRPPSPRDIYAHVHGMLEQIDKFVDAGDEESWDKASRWLGFAQGCFWVLGTFTLNQMRDHNRLEHLTDNKGAAS